MADHRPYPLGRAKLDGARVNAVAWVEQEPGDFGLKRLLGVATGRALSGTIEGAVGTVEYVGDIVENGQRRKATVTVILTNIKCRPDGSARAEFIGVGAPE